jgi:hypothetical protein
MRSWAASPFRGDLFTMFSSVAEHCRCVIGYRGQSYNSIPVYGLPSDLDYLDLLFTTLNLEVAKNMDPPVRAGGELGHEVFKQRQAGISWPRIAEKMYRAGLVSLTNGELKKLQGQWGQRADELDDPPTWEQIKERDWAYNSEIGEVRASIKNRLANARGRVDGARGPRYEAGRDGPLPAAVPAAAAGPCRSELQAQAGARGEGPGGRHRLRRRGPGPQGRTRGGPVRQALPARRRRPQAA